MHKCLYLNTRIKSTRTYSSTLQYTPMTNWYSVDISLCVRILKFYCASIGLCRLNVSIINSILIRLITHVSFSVSNLYLPNKFVRAHHFILHAWILYLHKYIFFNMCLYVVDITGKFKRKLLKLNMFCHKDVNVNIT